MVNLEFINQPMKGKKFYSFMYGPETQDCMYVSFKITGQFSDTNSLSLPLIMENTSICFILEANNSTKSVRVEGIHTISSGNSS